MNGNRQTLIRQAIERNGEQASRTVGAYRGDVTQMVRERRQRTVVSPE